MNAAVDERHTARLKEIVALTGWPTVSLVGPEAASAAWLLVQHADLDPAFQAHCLSLMKQLPDTEVSRINLAYLEDACGSTRTGPSSTAPSSTVEARPTGHARLKPPSI
jgi:hypothetical protein